MARKDVPDLLVCRTTQELQGDMTRSDPRHLILRLMEKTGQCEKVCYAAAFRSADRDLIEYGVAVRWPWLTDKGRALIGDQRGEA